MLDLSGSQSTWKMVASLRGLVNFGSLVHKLCQWRAS